MGGLLTPLLLLLVLGHHASCEDFVTGFVSKSSETESTRQSMPDTFTVNVTIRGHKVQLALKLDRNAHTDIPFYVFSRNKDGQLETKRVNRKKQKHFAVYHDVAHGAVISAHREAETGQSHLNLEGMLHVGGQVYHLKSAKRRHRNSTAAMAEGKTGFGGHDVKKRDVSGGDVTWSGQNEAGESHEFVVRLHDDLPPRSLRGDAIPPPIREEKMRAINVRGVELLLTPPPVAAPPARGQQTGPQDVYVDVVAVADYGVFSNWYSISSEITEEQKTLDVLDKLPEYYAFAFSGVNMLYQGINSTSFPYSIHVKLSTLLVATGPEDSEWTESLRMMGYTYDQVDADDALRSFSDWATASDLLPNYDHLTLFSGYQITSKKDDIGDHDLLGLAYVGTLCSKDSTSIIEDLGGLQRIFTIAHELGHSFSAKHDGDNNACSQEDDNIMAAIYDPINVTDKHSLWTFSHCSLNYFRNFLRQKMSTARGQQCLYNTVTPNKYIPDVSGQQPGQVYDHDAQCRQVFGPLSRMCRGLVSTPSDICMKMYCDSLTNDACSPNVAVRGTSCGDKKWCVNGDCVYDSRAPAMDEDCPFGDLPGRVWYSNQTCSEMIASNPSDCYYNGTYSHCCASCAKYYRPLQNCEYGDKVSGCTKWDCDNYLEECCGTCNYGTPIPTPSTAATTNFASFSITSNTTQISTPISSTTASTPSDRAHDLCMDTPDGVLGKACTDVVGASTGSCYYSYITTSCCASCRAFYTGVKGCEYGDRQDYCDRSQCLHQGDGYLYRCCGTCISSGTSATTTTTAIPTTTSKNNNDVNINNHGTCEDTTERIRGKSCLALIVASPASCYDSHVRTSCCASCRLRSTGVEGCEFGDRDPAQCSFAIVGDFTCKMGLEEMCCQTCTKTTPRHTTLNLLPYKIVYSSTPVQWRALVTPTLIGWIYVIACVAYMVEC